MGFALLVVRVCCMVVVWLGLAVVCRTQDAAAAGTAYAYILINYIGFRVGAGKCNSAAPFLRSYGICEALDFEPKAGDGGPMSL